MVTQWQQRLLHKQSTLATARKQPFPLRPICQVAPFNCPRRPLEELQLAVGEVVLTLRVSLSSDVFQFLQNFPALTEPVTSSPSSSVHYGHQGIFNMCISFLLLRNSYHYKSVY